MTYATFTTLLLLVNLVGGVMRFDKVLGSSPVSVLDLSFLVLHSAAVVLMVKLLVDHIRS